MQSRQPALLQMLAQNPGVIPLTRMELLTLDDALIHKLLLANPSLEDDALSKLLEICQDEVLYHFAYRQIRPKSLSPVARQRLESSRLLRVQALVGRAM